MKIVNVVGARPNLMKIAPLMAEMRCFPEIDPVLVHTGQHYDDNMSEVFFQELGIPQPEYNLGIGSGTHTCQTAQVMLAVEPLLRELRPDFVLVGGGKFNISGGVSGFQAVHSVGSRRGRPAHL